MKIFLNIHEEIILVHILKKLSLYNVYMFKENQYKIKKKN